MVNTVLQNQAYLLLEIVAEDNPWLYGQLMKVVVSLKA
jgi:hypothetical protein